MADTKYTLYYEQKQASQEQKLEEMIANLPEFSHCFFRELSRLENKATSTLIAYATDLKVFFTWTKDYVAGFSETDIADLPLDILNELHVKDIKEYMLNYVPRYSSEITVIDKEHPEGIEKEIIRKNSKTTSARKLATLKKFYHYFNNLDPSEKYYITNDPVSSVRQTKDTKEPVKYLTDEKTEALFNCISTGDGLIGKSAKWTEKTRERDRAIIALFLGTGMRVSELAGINIQDINFEKSSIRIFRKERREDTVFMSEKVRDTLLSYVVRSRDETFQPDEESENALFISYKHKRMSVSAIERCVSKYTRAVTGSDEYTCHKLRDTFGTRVYAETGGNAKKVQVAMNHKSASTTLDYYIAAMDGKEKENTFKDTSIAGL